MKRGKKHRLAPAGTQERKWQDAIRKANRLAKRFSKKPKKSARQNQNKKTRARAMSDFRNQYAGPVVDSQPTSKTDASRVTKKATTSCMGLFDNKLSDLRDELYPD